MRTKRIDLMEEYIFQEKSVSLDALCDKFQVSKNTIRRDIDLLVKKGGIKKVYGGVKAEESYPSIKKVVPFETRFMKFPEEKDRIAKAAAEFVEEKDVIYIDTGTTCLNIVDYISDKQCIILTSSLQVCIKAIPYPNLTVISLPGKLKRETLSFVGEDIANYLRTYNISKAFMACTGLTIENGLTNGTYEEYHVKKAVIENSRTHFLMADHSKFGNFSLMTFCKLDQLHHIITDLPPANEYQAFCREHQIAIHTTPGKEE